MKGTSSWLLKNSKGMPNIGFNALGEKELFKALLKSKLEVSLNLTWIRNSTKTCSLIRTLGREIHFCPRENQGSKEKS